MSTLSKVTDKGSPLASTHVVWIKTQSNLLAESWSNIRSDQMTDYCNLILAPDINQIKLDSMVLYFSNTNVGDAIMTEKKPKNWNVFFANYFVKV